MQKREKVCFITSDHNTDFFLKEFMDYHIVLDTEYWDLDGEVEKYEFCDIHFEKNDIVVVDSYFANKKYLDKLNAKCHTVYFDDEHKDIYNVSMIINYNLYYTLYDYKDEYCNRSKLLLGGAYVPLRDEFEHVPERFVENAVPQILIIVGGSDNYHVIKYILENGNQYLIPKYMYHIIVGRYNKDKEIIYRLAEGYDNIYLYENVTNMSELMSKCDIALSAASTFLYEACACSLPTVYFCVAPNQKNDRVGFENAKAHFYAGDVTEDFYGTVDNGVRLVEEILSDHEKYLSMKKRLPNVVDGKGAYRITEEIIKLKMHL